MKNKIPIAYWCWIIAVIWLVNNDASAQNVPEVLKRHEMKIRQLEERISNMETRLESYLNGETSNSVSGAAPELTCPVEENEDKTVGMRKTMTALSGNLKLRLIREIQSDNKGYFGHFKSNIKELEIKFYQGNILSFQVLGCKYTLHISRIDSQFSLVNIGVLDF